MVKDRPIRGVALGGASAGVGAVCQTVADRLAATNDVLASIWLERGGRLRCVATGAPWPAREVVFPATQVCLPIRSEGDVVGVLDVGLTRRPEAGDLERLRAAADALGREIAALGGPPAESAARRTLSHMTTLSALDDADAIARALLAAALDLTGLDSAALLRAGSERDEARGAEAPLAAVVLRAGGRHDEARAAVVPRAGAQRNDARAADAPIEAVPAVGPLGHALAGARAAALEAIGRAVADGGVAARGDLERPELRPLREGGARTLVAVGLVARAQCHGVLLLAAGTERTVSIDDLELLDLLAAHAATCLRTADVVRTLRERAATDPLTGLGHYATFHDQLAHAHRRPSTAVVLVDVDGFKHLNDTFGHQHGDDVLREIAAALRGALRRGDRLFRIGGDEFAALLAVSEPDDALEAGARLRAAVTEADLGVTVSIGVAVPHEGESDAALLARADGALYRVKRAGRDGVALADDEALPVGPPL